MYCNLAMCGDNNVINQIQLILRTLTLLGIW